MSAEKHSGSAQSSSYTDGSHLVTKKQILSITRVPDADLERMLQGVNPVAGNGSYELKGLIAHLNANGYVEHARSLHQLWHPWRSAGYRGKAGLPESIPDSPGDLACLQQAPDDAKGEDEYVLPDFDYIILPQSNHPPRKKRDGESRPALMTYLAEMGKTQMLSLEQTYLLFQTKWEATEKLYTDCLDLKVFRDKLSGLLNQLKGSKQVAKSYEKQHRNLQQSITKIKRAMGKKRLTGKMLQEEIGYPQLKPLVETTLEYLGDDPEYTEAKALLENQYSEIDRLRKEVANANLRLVVSVAKRYRNTPLSLIDRIQEGNEGLMQSIDRFDHHRGNKFGTYAVWWIRQKISRAIANNGGVVRIPIDMRLWYGDHQKAYENLSHALGRSPTSKEVAQQLGLDERAIEMRLQAFQPEIPIDKPVGDDSSIGQFIKDTRLPNPLESLNPSHSRELLDHALSTLTEREEVILRLRYGIGTSGQADSEPMTLGDIGTRFAITRERVRQLEQKAIRRLRNPLRSRKLKTLLD